MSGSEPDASPSSPDPSAAGTGTEQSRDSDATTRRGVLASLGSMLAVPTIAASAGPTTAASHGADWPQYHGRTGRTGRSAAEDPEEPTRTRWTLEVASDGEGRHDRTAPVVAGGTMFTANVDGNLVAVDVPSGTVEWVYEASGGVQIAPAVGDSRVFLGTGDGDMVALNRETGEIDWSKGAGGSVSAPALSEGTVYFGQSGENVAEIMSFDARSGDIRWQTDVSTTETLPFPSAMTAPTPAVVGDAVVANVQNLEDAGRSGLVGLAGDGTEQWQTSLGHVCYPPSVTENTCYAITAESVNRVSIAGGSVRWETAFEPHRPGAEPRIIPGVATVGEEAIYVQKPTGVGELGFVALNARTGEREWSYVLDSGPSVGSGISTTGSLVYFALQGELVAVNAESGLEEWTYRLTEDVLERGVPNTGRRSGSAPIVTQDGILVKHLGTIHAVDARSTAGTDGQPTSQSQTSTRPDGSDTNPDTGGRETQIREGTTGTASARNNRFPDIFDIIATRPLQSMGTAIAMGTLYYTYRMYEENSE